MAKLVTRIPKIQMNKFLTQINLLETGMTQQSWTSKVMMMANQASQKVTIQAKSATFHQDYKIMILILLKDTLAT